jgi:hypothetical protein
MIVGSPLSSRSLRRQNAWTKSLLHTRGALDDPRHASDFVDKLTGKMLSLDLHSSVPGTSW